MVRVGRFGETVLVLSLVLVQIYAISNLEANVQNAITEEERRGADNAKANTNANDKKNGKIAEDNAGDKKTRGIVSIHSPSASFKHQQYFVPSAYDSHIAATGHGGGGSGGSANFAGSTSGYDYAGPVGHAGHGVGSTAPTSAGAPGGGHAHGHIHHHNGPTGYASATGFGGYGLAHGYGPGPGAGGQGGHGGFILGGPHGHSGHGHGHELYGGGHGGGHGGGIHNALALKGLLIPLAGIALLGAAAALSTNPVLLQLGVVNGRRRRRSVSGAQYPANPHVQPDSHY